MARYLPFQSVHGPYEAPMSFVELYNKTIVTENRRIHQGMVTALDQARPEPTPALAAASSSPTRLDLCDVYPILVEFVPASAASSFSNQHGGSLTNMAVRRSRSKSIIALAASSFSNFSLCGVGSGGWKHHGDL